MSRRPVFLDEAQQQSRYLEAISKAGTLSAGCRAARCSFQTVYKWRKEDEAFAAKESEAREGFADRLEEIAVIRAERTSDTLLMMLLKAVRPEKYKERQQTDGTLNVSGQVQFVPLMPPG